MESEKYLETNDNGKQLSKINRDAANTVLRGSTGLPLKKKEKSQINNLNLYLKELEKERQSPKLVEGRK